jgi:hypothetical protein
MEQSDIRGFPFEDSVGVIDNPGLRFAQSGPLAT